TVAPLRVATQRPLWRSPRAAARAATTSRARGAVSRLPCSGRHNVSTATRPRRSTVSSAIGLSAELLLARHELAQADEVVELVERSEPVRNRVRREAFAHEGLHHFFDGLVHREHRLDGTDRVVEAEIVDLAPREIRALTGAHHVEEERQPEGLEPPQDLRELPHAARSVDVEAVNADRGIRLETRDRVVEVGDA